MSGRGVNGSIRAFQAPGPSSNLGVRSTPTSQWKDTLSIKPEDYLHVVKMIARQMKRALPAQVDVEDLESAGYFGLIDAAKRYDPGRKTKFETFASIRIRGAILDELRRLDWVPRLVRQRKEEPIGMTGFSDIASGLPTEDEDDAEFIIEDPTEDLRINLEVRLKLEDAISVLKPKYQEAVRLYYFDGWTLRETAGYMNTTESRVCQILKRAIPILRKELELKERL